jgi:hypothetical protein
MCGDPPVALGRGMSIKAITMGGLLPLQAPHLPALIQQRTIETTHARYHSTERSRKSSMRGQSRPSKVLPPALIAPCCGCSRRPLNRVASWIDGRSLLSSNVAISSRERGLAIPVPSHHFRP